MRTTGVPRVLAAFVGLIFSLSLAPSALAAESGQITGTVTNASTQEAVDGLEVCAIAVSNGEAWCGTTEASGQYVVIGLPTGGYRVKFGAEVTHKFNYVPQFYDDKSSSSAAAGRLAARMRRGG